MKPLYDVDKYRNSANISDFYIELYSFICTAQCPILQMLYIEKLDGFQYIYEKLLKHVDVIIFNNITYS